jgi:hypothetical protein
MSEGYAVERRTGALNVSINEDFCSGLHWRASQFAAELLPRAETRQRELIVANGVN